MPLPPPGHPHYMSDEAREALESKTNLLDADEEPIETTSVSATAQKQYRELRAKIVAAKKQMEETAKGLFKDMSNAFFEANPEIMGFSWTQYTPYYCDGDVCEFGANTDYPEVAVMIGDELYAHNPDSDDVEVNGVEVRTLEEYQRMFQGLGTKNAMSIIEDGKTISYDPKTGKVTRDGAKIKGYDDYRKIFSGPEKKVAKFLQVFEEEDLETMFGDHKKITVTRDGEVGVEGYDHD
jgi:hypothetical protein